jgi:hypothetical protein
MRRKRIIVGTLLLMVTAAVWGVFHHVGALPCWIVWGQITNENNNPIKNAIVKIQLGVGAESEPSVSSKNGRFISYVVAPIWSVAKGGPPSITVHSAGYREYWGYYHQWTWGLKISRIDIKLQKGPESPPVHEDLKAANTGTAPTS